MTTISSLQTHILDLPPSCIQFNSTHPDLFVVGTYFLHGKEHLPESQAPEQDSPQPENDDAFTGPQKRTGSLILFRLEHENNRMYVRNPSSLYSKLMMTRGKQLFTVPIDYAVLDIQWSPHEPSLLAVAASTGIVAFYRLAENGEELVLENVKKVAEPEILVLSLTWHPTRTHVLGLTLSDGSVLLHELQVSLADTDKDDMQVSEEIHAHELEAWILCFNTGADGSETDVVLSGGDDMVLRCSSITSSPEQGTTFSATSLWQDRKLHSAGITFLHPLSSTLVLTGSYDDHIRLLQTSPRRTVLAELNLGGGVWRLRRLPLNASIPRPGGENRSLPELLDHVENPRIRSYTILASCMHAGARIVQLAEHQEGDRRFWKFEVLCKFEEHESMNYGSDVHAASRTVVSTSFYDKRMCLWRF